MRLKSLFVMLLIAPVSLAAGDVISQKVLPFEPQFDVKGGGPDDYGYVWLDSSDPGGPVYDWIEIDPDSGGSGEAIHFSPDYNDGYAWVHLNQPFWFYGQRFDSVAVSVNGWASFIDGVESFYGTIPSPTVPNGVIAPLWRDLVFYANYGDDDSAYVAYLPDEQLTVIEWNEISKLGSWPTNFTFQIVLNHSDNTITFQYARATDWAASRPVTVGIESPDGNDGLSIPNADGRITNGYAIRFYPPPVVDTMMLDDGIVSANWAWDSAGYGFGEKFVLPAHPLETTVNGVFVYVPDWPSGSGGSFTAMVVDNDGLNGAPGTILYQNSMSVVRGIWNYLDFGEVEDGDGIFYIFLVQEQDYPNSPALSTDSSPNLPNGFIWEYRQGQFVQSSSEYFGGEFLIRPVVSFYPRNTDGAAMWIENTAQAEPYVPMPLTGVVSSGGLLTTSFPVVIDILNSGGTTVFHDSAQAAPYLNELMSINFRAWVPTDTGEYTIRMYVSCLNDPNHENDTVYSVVRVVNVHEGGPDCWNYTFKDSRAAGGPTFNWIEISGTGTPLDVGADSFVTVALPFTFPFYGGEFDSIDISANGVAGFGTGAVSPQNGSMEDAPPMLIAAYWADLDPSAHGGVYYQQFGDSVVIEWKDVPEAREWGYNSFEIVLHRRGDIQVNYLALPRYSDETAGIRGDSCYLQVFYDGEPYVPGDSMAVRFYRVDYDVRAVSAAPTGHLIPWRPVEVTGRVKNLGSETANFEVRTEIIDTATGLVAWASTATVTGLATLEEREVDFGQFEPGRDSIYLVKVYTQLVGDANPHNDTACTRASSVMRFGDRVFGPMILDQITGQQVHQAVEFDGRYFYITTTGNSNLLYVLDTSGVLLRVFVQPTTGAGWRDIAWQEMDTGSVSGIIDTLYASTGGEIEKFGLNLNTGEIIFYGNFAGPMSYHRALAYSVQRKTFFAADLNSPIYEFTREDSVVRIIPNPHNIEAMAWDEGLLGDTVGYLWMATDEENDSGSHITVYQFDEALGTYTGVAITPPPLFDGNEKANGVAFWRDFTGFSTLFVVVEGDTDYLVGYFIRYADTTRQVNPSVEEGSEEGSVGFSVRPKASVIENGELKLRLVLPRSAPVRLSVYNAAGRLLLRRELVGRKGAGEYAVDISSLPAGVYYAVVRSEFGSSRFRLISVGR